MKDTMKPQTKYTVATIDAILTDWYCTIVTATNTQKKLAKLIGYDNIVQETIDMVLDKYTKNIEERLGVVDDLFEFWCFGPDIPDHAELQKLIDRITGNNQ